MSWIRLFVTSTLLAPIVLNTTLIHAKGGIAPGEETIAMGVVRLWLGMERRDVINRLRSQYTVRPTHEDDPSGSLMVVTKEGPPFSVLGTVYFRGARLSSVYRDWSPDDQERAFEFASLVYGVFSELIKEGKSSCMISAGAGQAPDSEQKTVTFSCGAKRIEVSTLIYSQGRGAMITEMLGTP